eukprot:gene18006-biopygen11697
MFCRIDDQRLQWLGKKSSQQRLRIADRAELQEYCETISADDGTDALLPGRLLLPSSHTDLTARVFKHKLDEFLAAIRSGKVGNWKLRLDVDGHPVRHPETGEV